MTEPVLWALLAVFAAAGIAAWLRFRGELDVWKTKKDFDFDELDRLLKAEEYKYEVSKYLHKYKSNRRQYENRIVRFGVFAVLAAVAVLVCAVFLAVRWFI